MLLRSDSTEHAKGQSPKVGLQKELAHTDSIVAESIEPTPNMALETTLVNILLTFSARGTRRRGRGQKGRGSDDVESWFRGLRNRGDRHDFEFAARICWALWYNRNQEIFEGNGMPAHEIVENARRRIAHERGSTIYDPS
ncbi:hypothetical protein Salat_2657900 [Sesamum alatum]|uniref:Uncharacterized protein n=1 Tax=Sesamum alatum TaxID=300844 RepID=A0AAE2CB61_9LAMI|nr:hypothetical protein Salat_2657900 [Sesamum alatum]